MTGLKKFAVTAAVFTVSAFGLAGCDGGSVSVSSDTAKSMACSTARASNQAGKISDDLRKQLAQAIADSVHDDTIKGLAQRVHDSDTPEQVRAAFDDLIAKACGAERPAQAA